MASNGIAQITYENVQLTNGNLALPTLEAVRAQGSGITVNLAEDASRAVNRVVYILYRKNSEQRLQFVSSVIAEGAGTDGTFRATLPYTEGDIVLYAYGMRDTSESASAKYGNMQVANAVDVARLTAFRNISTEDFQFTETRGATMYADQDELTPVPEGSARVFVTALGGGSVSGGGVYVIGENATIVATPESGYHFIGWRVNGSDEYVSTNASYTFEVEGTADLVAVFEATTPGLSYLVTVRLAANQYTSGTKIRINNREFADTDSIEVDAGTSVTITADANGKTGIKFGGWLAPGGAPTLSRENPYTFVPSDNITLVANWEDDSL